MTGTAETPPPPPEPSPGGPPPSPDGPPPGAAREAGCLAGLGLLLLPLLAWGFAARAGLTLPDSLFLAALLGLLPALSVAQVPLVDHASVDRIGAYLGSSAMLLVIGAAALALGADEPGLEAMGLGGMPVEALVAWTGGLLAAAALLQALFLFLGRVLRWRESPLLEELLPRTGREKRVFVGVSVTAGLGEEIAFRGYAIPMLAPVLGGPWEAVAFSSAVFGLLHAYQGTIGIVRTATFGGILAASFVLSGSLWPAIIAHFAVDVIVGVWLGRRWLEPSAHSGDAGG